MIEDIRFTRKQKDYLANNLKWLNLERVDRWIASLLEEEKNENNKSMISRNKVITLIDKCISDGWEKRLLIDTIKNKRGIK